MIAEESSSWPMVTKPPYVGGLGFSFKWNMGWMNDMLNYASLDPLYRAYHHDKLTFGLFYAFSENFILPVSHDEVVHGKYSLIGKMPGDYWKKFAACARFGIHDGAPRQKAPLHGQRIRAVYRMGLQKRARLAAFGLPHAQNDARIRPHAQLALPRHAALFEADDSWEGFKWLVLDDNANNIVSFARLDEKGAFLVVLINFAPVVRHQYRIGVPRAGVYREILNSDAKAFGGSGGRKRGPDCHRAKSVARLCAVHRNRSPPIGGRVSFVRSAKPSKSLKRLPIAGAK